MTKPSMEKCNFKSSNKICDNKITLSQTTIGDVGKIKKKNKNKEINLIKSELIKKECVISEDLELVPEIPEISVDKSSENPDSNVEKNSKLRKKFLTKSSKDTDENKLVFLTDFGHLKLSQSVIVNSVIKGTKIDQKIEAILPENLSFIYNRFINSNRYIESLHSKDDFFCGIGLLGVNIEEKIYNKRKSLEDSLRRGIRLRPNPKPTKLFDGTVINRPSRHSNNNHSINNNGLKSFKSSSRPIILRGKTKYNLFNIGNDSTKRKSRRAIRKPLKKQKLNNTNSNNNRTTSSQKKDPINSGSSDEEIDDINSKSIAFTRPKRQQKVPKLDFKYCYADRINSGNRKFDDSNSDGEKSTENGRKEFMEIVDSDSSSVVEVSPPNNIDLSEESDEVTVGKSKETEKSRRNRCQMNMRRGWRPKESKALNLLDKLRLGLQCRIIHTENDIIIQNLSLDDLSTLQSRLQGLATFKNIEAEYDKNGQETARATIDRKLLNLPLKPGDCNSTNESTSKIITPKKYEDSLKRKLFPSQSNTSTSNNNNNNNNRPNDRKKLVLHHDSKFSDESNGKFSKSGCHSNNNYYKSEENSSVWIRPKGRSVKKVRKLYTQSGSTPNILARSQIGSNRTDNLMTSSSAAGSSSSSTGASASRSGVSNNQSGNSKSSQNSLSFSQPSIIGSDHSHSTTVSFYSQLSTISSSIIAPVVPVIAKPITNIEAVKPVANVSITELPVTGVSTTTAPSLAGDTFTTVATADDSSGSISGDSVVIISTENHTNNNNLVATNSNSQSPSSQFCPLESVKKPIGIDKVTTQISNRSVDLVSPATSMSASQLLMLKRGGSGPGASTGGSHDSMGGSGSSGSAASFSVGDQLYANHILKPFKKTFVTSSPPKLELDDEDVEADFELTPSMITQVKNVAVSNNLSNSQTIPNKNTFLSKPLIQASGILSGSRRPISLTNTPIFQTPNQNLTAPSQIPPLNSKPITVCVVTAQPITLPNTSITTAVNPISANVSNSNSSNSNTNILNTNSNSNNNNSSNSSTANTSTNINNVNDNSNNNNQNNCQNSNSNVKVKHRKWTHNFHTSNSINFREVLCPSRSNNIVQPILGGSPIQQLANSNPNPNSSCSISSVNSIPVPKPITIPNTISTNLVNPLRSPEKSNQIPSKGSSAVLKSLLVGSNSTNDLCNINKSANWASKYLSSTSSLQDSSKIKWQVGGTVITSMPSLMTPVSKETSSLEIINTTNNK